MLRRLFAGRVIEARDARVVFSGCGGGCAGTRGNEQYVTVRNAPERRAGCARSRVY